jgi:hypothetical protein
VISNLIHDELEIMWKEAVVVYFKSLPWNFSGTKEESHEESQ